MLKPFGPGWAPPPNRPVPIWMMSPGFLMLARALENAVDNGDLTRREAGLLVHQIEMHITYEYEDVSKRQRRQARAAQVKVTADKPVIRSSKDRQERRRRASFHERQTKKTA